VENEYLDHYLAALKHQIDHVRPGGVELVRHLGQPEESCFTCLMDPDMSDDAARFTVHHGVKRRYSWAVPNDAAIDAIAKYSPSGIVEIGAGGGYWAMLLRGHGIDVIAFDPDPVGGPTGWHDGHQWSEVLQGDHHRIKDYPDRTLLLVWPSYTAAWSHEVIEEYRGDTVIYVGEGPGGCCGDDRMHELLVGCGCYETPCTCTPAQFRLVEDTEIPQWAGIHDRLTVHRRV
jgi:hypothetical protein